jgi:hypothetical protein
MGFISSPPGFVQAQVLSCGRQMASSCCRLCTPDVDSFSLILIFYHLVSVLSRWLSGVSDFGLRPLSDLATV